MGPTHNKMMHSQSSCSTPPRKRGRHVAPISPGSNHDGVIEPWGPRKKPKSAAQRAGMLDSQYLEACTLECKIENAIGAVEEKDQVQLKTDVRNLLALDCTVQVQDGQNGSAHDINAAVRTIVKQVNTNGNESRVMLLLKKIMGIAKSASPTQGVVIANVSSNNDDECVSPNSPAWCSHSPSLSPGGWRESSQYNSDSD